MELPALIMDPIGDLFASVESIAFVIFALIAIAGAIGTIRASRVAHSMLWLIAAFFAVFYFFDVFFFIAWRSVACFYRRIGN